MTPAGKAFLKRQASKAIYGGLLFVATIVFFMIPHFSTLVHEIGHNFGAVLGIGLPGGIIVDWDTGAGLGGGPAILRFSTYGGAYSIFYIVAYLLVRRLHVFGVPAAIVWVYWGIDNYLYGLNYPGGASDFADGHWSIIAGIFYTIILSIILNELLMLRARKRRRAKAAEAKAKAIKAAESALRAKARSLGGPTRSAPSPVSPRSPARTRSGTLPPLRRP